MNEKMENKPKKRKHSDLANKDDRSNECINRVETEPSERKKKKKDNSLVNLEISHGKNESEIKSIKKKKKQIESELSSEDSSSVIAVKEKEDSLGIFPKTKIKVKKSKITKHKQKKRDDMGEILIENDSGKSKDEVQGKRMKKTNKFEEVNGEDDLIHRKEKTDTLEGVNKEKDQEFQANRKKKKKKDKSSSINKENDNEEKCSEKSAQDLAIRYLKQWKKHRDEWKFQKVRQVWLLSHMYNPNLVSNKHFRTLLMYLDGIKGMGRQTTSNKAQNIIDTENDDTVKVDRARQVIQQLSTE